MAIFDRIPEEQLGTRFTHYGWFGLCPIYIQNPYGEAPTLVERNWIPEWWMSLSEMLCGTAMFLRTLFDPSYEPLYAIRVCGEIIRGGEDAIGNGRAGILQRDGGSKPGAGREEL